MNHTMWEIQGTNAGIRKHNMLKRNSDTGVGLNENRSKCIPVFGTDVRHNVLVEEFEDEGDAVGKHQMLSHIFKLSRMGRKHSVHNNVLHKNLQHVNNTTF